MHEHIHFTIALLLITSGFIAFAVCICGYFMFMQNSNAPKSTSSQFSNGLSKMFIGKVIAGGGAVIAGCVKLSVTAVDFCSASMIAQIVLVLSSFVNAYNGVNLLRITKQMMQSR